MSLRKAAAENKESQKERSDQKAAELRITASYILSTNVRITKSKMVAQARHAEPIRKLPVRKTKD